MKVAGAFMPRIANRDDALRRGATLDGGAAQPSGVAPRREFRATGAPGVETPGYRQPSLRDNPNGFRRGATV